jgi:type I restriction enzyme S subunit
MIPLNEVLEFIVDNRGKTVPTSDSGIPLIATNCIKNTELFPTYDKIRYVSEETYDNWFRAHPEPGDIIFVNKGKPGSVAMVPDPVDFCIAQDMMAFRVDKEVIYNKYLFAVLRNPKFQNRIMNMHVGTMIPHFKKGDLDKLMIPVPSIKVQKFIGDLYYKISYKIEVNNQINETLENMAQELFKRWFVDFEFPNENGEPYQLSGGEMIESELGLIPIGWEVNEFNNLAENVSGYSYKGKDLEDSKDALITIKNFNRNGGFKVEGFKDIKISERVKEKHYADLLDIIVAHTDLTQNADIIGNPIMIMNKSDNNNLIFSMDTVKVIPKLNESRYFVFQLLKHSDFKNFALAHTSGTTVLHLSKKAIPKYKFSSPPEDLIKKYNNTVEPFFRKNMLIHKENEKLKSIRDTLLPRLMSGEIRVPLEGLEESLTEVKGG